MSPEIESKAPPTFQMVSFAVAKAVYELVDGDPIKTGPRPPNLQVKLQMIAGVKLFAIQTAEGAGQGAFVELDCKVLPDREWQPYWLEVKVAGAFQSLDGTPEDMIVFCKKAAPSILFPYDRETVHRLTMDAPAGVVRLDPMNISALLNQNEWGETSFNPPSSEPQPPPSQSASASPQTEPQP